MKNNLTLFSAFLCIGFLVFINVDSFAQTKVTSIDKLLTTYQKYGQFNGSALVAENGRVIYEKGFGFANIEWDIPNTPDTKFRIGSITKSFTAVLIFQLIEKGRLDLNGKVSAYLPDFPKPKGDNITIKQLLTHTAGLRDISDFPRNSNNFPAITAKINSGYANIEELVQIIGDYELLYEPGTGFRYSNDGYIVLGRIIEQITKKPYETVLLENILMPLGMKNSGMNVPKHLVKRKATGYDQTFFGYENGAPVASTPASGMYSTVGDLKLFSTGLLSNKLLSDSSKALMFSESVNVVAYGWKVRKIRDETDREKTLIITDGSLPGFTSFMVREVESDRLFILLINTREMTHKIGDIYGSLSNILADKPYNKPKRSIATELFRTASTENISRTIQKYEQIKNDPTYSINENEMNAAGYQLVSQRKIKEAIAIFKLTTEAFPTSANAFDSLGEAYMMNGEKDLAIKNYERSVELNPQNQNGIEMLKKLRGR